MPVDGGSVEYRFESNAEELKAQVKQAEEAIRKGAEAAGKAGGASKEAGKEAEGAGKKSEEAGKKGEEAGNKASAAAKKASAAVKAFAVAAAAAIGKVIKEGVEYNAQIESYTQAFATLLGSEEAAVSKLEELKNFAAVTPFELSDVAKATQTMLSFGISADKTSEYLQYLGDVSMGNKERLDSLTLAFSQVSAAGKLTGQDMRQMIDAGFNPLQEIAEMTGETIGELQERMSAGGVSAEEVAEAFAHATQEGGRFYQSMEKQSKTLSGQLSTLKDNAKAFLGSLTSGLSTTISQNLLPKANALLQDLNENADEVAGTLKSIAIAAGTVWASFKAWKLGPIFLDAQKKFLDASASLNKLADAADDAKIKQLALSGQLNLSQIAVAVLTGKISLATAAQTAWNTVIKANPLGALLTVITLVSGAVTILKDAFEDTEPEFESLQYQIDSLKEANDELKQSVSDSRKEFNESTRDIESNTIESQSLISSLMRLSENYKGTTFEQERMSFMVSRLNELNEGLNLTFDEQTGALNMTKQAMEDYIAAYEETAKMRAAMKRVQDITDQLASVQWQIEETKAAIREAEDAANSESFGFSAFRDGDVEVRRLKEDLSLLEAQEKSLTGEHERASIALDGYSESAIVATDATDGLTESIDAETQAVDAATAAQNMLNEVAALTEPTIESVADRIEEYANRAQDGFNKIDTESGISLENFKANLEHNAEVMRKWSEDLATLSKRGVNDGFLQYLRDAGPESSGLISELANSSDEELQAVVDAWEQGGNDAVSAYEEDIATLSNTLPPIISDAITQALLLASQKALEFGDVGRIISDAIQSNVEPVTVPVKIKVSGPSGYSSAFSQDVADRVTQNKYGSISRYKTGIDFVGHDYTPAFLDYGERVLTKEENAAFTAMGGVNGMQNLARLATIEQSVSGGVGGGRPISLTVPLTVDGREIARASAYWTSEQLSWEEMRI